MIKRLASAPTLNLARRPNDPELLVDMEAFFEFSFWMAEELQDLVCQYQLNEQRETRRQTSASSGSGTPSGLEAQFEAPYDNWVEWDY